MENTEAIQGHLVPIAADRRCGTASTLDAIAANCGVGANPKVAADTKFTATLNCIGPTGVGAPDMTFILVLNMPVFCGRVG